MRKFLIITALFNSILLAEEYIDYTFTYLSETANSVQIEGDFTGWMKISMDKSGKLWSKTFRIKKGSLYEYRFIVDGNIELDPKNKNKSDISNASILYLDQTAKNELIGNKNININLLHITIKELTENQKKLLGELELIRNELVKKDLQLELLRTQLEKIRIENKEKDEMYKMVKTQNDELNRKFDILNEEMKKLQEENKLHKKEYKTLQYNYLNCTKKNAKMREELKNLRAKPRRKIEKTLDELNNREENNTPSDTTAKEKKPIEKQMQPLYIKVGKIYEISNTTNLLVIYIYENADLSKEDTLYVLENNDVKATLMITSVEKEWCYAKIISGDKNDLGKKEVYKMIAPTTNK